MLIHMDYSFLEEVASHLAKGDENAQQSDEEIVLMALEGTADEKLTSFAMTKAPQSERLFHVRKSWCRFIPHLLLSIREDTKMPRKVIRKNGGF